MFSIYICIIDSQSTSANATQHKYYTHASHAVHKPAIVTSVKVDEDLWKRAKKRAIDEEITLQELLNAAVQDYLRKKALTEYRRKKKEN